MFTAQSSFSGFSVDDIVAAKQFYTHILNLSVIDESMGLQLKLPSGESLFLYQKDDHVPATFTVLNFVVSDIDAAIDELKQVGVNFDKYPNLPAPQDEKGILRGREAGQGPDIAWFKDPAGNILSVLQE